VAGLPPSLVDPAGPDEPGGIVRARSSGFP
jgi:hypothetical protein